MTQRVFDVENEKDMQDLWDILPDEVVLIKQRFADGSGLVFLKGQGGALFDEMKIIAINWHDKTEITRPVNYKNMIGCVGWFSSHKNTKKDDMIFGILNAYNKNDNLGRCFYCHCDTWYKYFFPAKKCDVKFYGVDKDE